MTDRPMNLAQTSSPREQRAAARGWRRSGAAPSKAFGSSGGRFVLTGLFGGVCVLFGRVYRAISVVGRPVDGVEDERVGTGVAEIVSGAGWHSHQVALIHAGGLAGDVGLSACAVEGEDLVGFVVGTPPSRSTSPRAGRAGPGPRSWSNTHSAASVRQPHSQFGSRGAWTTAGAGRSNRITGRLESQPAQPGFP